MSKSVASESNEGHESGEMSGKRGGEDEESQNQSQGQGAIVAPAAPTTKDDFMATDDFMRLLRGYVDVAVLFHTFRLASKPWQRISEEKIDGDFRSGVLAFYVGNDVPGEIIDDDDYEFWGALEPKHEPMVRVFFLLNITNVRSRACYGASNLVVVDVPEGVVSIDGGAFMYCNSLATASFPTTLKAIVWHAFDGCESLENVYLFHTNLQELGERVFYGCSELKSMTIPDSLQTLCDIDFERCYKLVPSNINPQDNNMVVVYIRSQQRIAELEKMLAERDATIVAQAAENAALTTENADLKDLSIDVTFG
ncbi:hypothetical protein TL16_g11204 [Triparma laevis f. inornata]|uniref:Uncharacterized protein n=1 Tax=Triparma laevis f. inornata TaxID=1714386 RepID=A0A9W7BDL6_9STRA|nr:hypothetical protein TL16_g11204 [Triparma laevis f. inornata]